LARSVQETDCDWNMLIPLALFAYRTTKNRTTKYEPFYLLYGRALTLPLELNVATWPAEELDEEQYEELIKKRVSEVASIFTDNKIKTT